MIDADTYDEFETWQAERRRRTVALALAELRRLCHEEDDHLEVGERRDRNNPFSDPGE